jgi:hypothetical protein
LKSEALAGFVGIRSVARVKEEVALRRWKHPGF